MATGLFNLKQVNQAISQGAWSGYIAPRWVEYLVVAGGGSGNYLGGGGAGGLSTGIVTVAAGTSYTVTIGAGGTGVSGAAGQGTAGVSSVFGSISATGGGLGVNNYQNVGSTNNGGSGGGGPGINLAGAANSPNTGGNGVVGQGNSGGSGINNAGTYYGGGGGGAGTVGLNAVNASSAGNGGAGIASSISGTVITYAGGGGGGTVFSATGAGAGGVGGGGAGGIGSGGGTSGTANTGGGGGSSSYNGSFSVSGSGGSGIVVVRYPGNVQFYTGGTVTYSNGYIVHNFTANGTLAPTTPTVVSEYQISRSLRFNPADSAYLNRTPGSATNQRTWTWSAWVKRSTLDDFQTLFSASSSGSANYLVALFFANNNLDFAVYGSGGSQEGRITSTAVYRDVSAWYHVVAVMDTTQATSSDRLRFYVNGVQVTALGTASYPTQNNIYGVNSTVAHTMGTYSFNTSLNFFKGYMTEINFVDGQALTPTSFGYVNPTTGIWSPAKFVGGYGTNGFYLNFSDNSNTTAATLGADYSGNGNNWTPNNFSVTAGAGNDSLVDSPTSYGTDTGVGGTVRGNYCTLNPLNTGTNASSSNGNLTYSCGVNSTITGTFGITSGKWYWEVQNPTAKCVIGIVNSSATLNTYIGVNVNGWGYYGTNGQKFNNGGSAYGATFTTTDVIGVAFDADAGTLVFYKNNTSQGTAFTGLTSGPYFVAVSDDTTGGATGDFNFGQRAFAYTAPSGFKALCTQNLPTPTIGATTATTANKFFDVSLWTGNGSSQSITNGGFQPDWVWTKSRSVAQDARLVDSVRGVSQALYSQLTIAEATESTGITAFNSSGFSVGSGSSNSNAVTYVGWQWKGGGTGVSNTAGSITSTVSANTTSGFSVVTYTGNGSAATIGHGLGVAPSMYIVKNRTGSADEWVIYHSSLPSAAYYLTFTNGSQNLNNVVFNSTAPTSTVFSVGTSRSTNTVNYVAYCFAEVAGYSKFGSYTGNSSLDGPFVNCGFRPRFVMMKRTDTGGTNWQMYDTSANPYNVTGNYQTANLSNAEEFYATLDILSNGFRLKNVDGGINGSGNTYIFAAFAETPFKYSLAR